MGLCRRHPSTFENLPGKRSTKAGDRETGLLLSMRFRAGGWKNQRVRSQICSLHFRACCAPKQIFPSNPRCDGHRSRCPSLNAKAFTSARTRNAQDSGGSLGYPSPSTYDLRGGCCLSRLPLRVRWHSSQRHSQLWTPSMGEFVEMMGAQGFIEGTVGPNKKTRRLLHLV